MPRFMYQDVMTETTASVGKIFSQLNLDAAFGAGTRELLDSTLEEFTGLETRDEWEMCCFCCILCCHTGTACMDCCMDLSYDRRHRRQYSLAEAPQQEAMEDDKPKQSLLERIASLTSEDLSIALRRVMSSEEWTAQERLGFWLFEKKFSEPERLSLEKCMEEVKAAAPELLEKAHINATEAEHKMKSQDAKALAKFIKLFAATAVANHGAAIAAEGLSALNIGACEKVLCAGDLKYELDPTGLHKCTWSCPAADVGAAPMIPTQFQSVGLSLAEQVQEVEPLRQEVADAIDAANETEKLHSEEDFEKSKAWAMIRKLKVDFHQAINGDPLVLLKTGSPSELGHAKPNAVRYHGRCAPDVYYEGERLIYTGSNKDIPHGAVVKIMRVAGGWLFSVPAGHVEVKYLGKKVIVPSSEVKRQAMGKVKIDEGLQDWLMSTGNSLQVQMPAKHDPSRQEVADTMWFPVSRKDKGE